MKAAVKNKAEPKPVPGKKTSPAGKAASPFFSANLFRSAGHSLNEKTAESEADTIAKKIVSDSSYPDINFSIGRSIVDTIVQNTTPAVKRAISGSGTPMAATLKQWMSSRLGRKFSKVRIHDDLVAHEAARSLGARAFTYGDHIYFAARQYQPDTTEGKELIAHELVHTIQQEKGRKGIQRKPSFFELLTHFAEEIAPGMPFATIMKLHRNANKDDKALLKKIDTLTPLENDLPQLFSTAQKMAEAATVPGQEKELDLLFDIYKYKGIEKYTEAADLAKKKKYLPLKTAYYNPEFYKQVLMGDLDWLPGHPAISKHFNDFIDTFHMMFMGQSGMSIDLYRRAELESDLKKIIADAKAQTGLLDNERAVVSMKTLLLADNDRLFILKAMISAVWNKGLKNEAADRLRKAFSATDLLSEIVNGSKLEEIAYLWTKAAPLIKSKAAGGVDFWKNVLDGVERLKKNVFFQKAYIDAFKRNKEYFKKGEYETILVKAATDFLQLTPEGKMPDAKQFEAQKRKSRGPVKEKISFLGLEIIRLTRRPDPKADKDLPHLCGILYHYLKKLNTWLDPAIDINPDAAKSNPGNSLIYDRLNFGTELRNIGVLLGSEELINIGREVRRPTKDPASVKGAQSESFFAFGPNPQWKIDELPARQNLKKFMDENTVIDESKLMAGALVYFMKSSLYKTEAKLLKDELAKIDLSIISDTPEDYTPIPNRVYHQLDEMSKDKGELLVPRRYILSDVYFSPAPADQEKFADAIIKNDTIKNLSDGRFGKQSMGVYPQDVDKHFEANGIVEWVLSEEGVRAFDKEMKDLAGTGITNDIETDPMGWFNAFEARVKLAENPPAKGTAGTTPLVDIKAIDKYLTDTLAATLANLQPLRRKGMSYHRRVLLKHKLRPLWEAYKENVSHIESWDNPTKAIHMLIDMAGPPILLGEDNQHELKLQITTGLLELAETIYSSLLDQGLWGGASTSRIGMVARLLPHVTGALSLEKEVAAKRDELLVEYPSEKHADKVAVLNKLAPGLLSVLKKEYEHEETKIFNTTNMQFLTTETVGDWLSGIPKTANSSEAQLKDHHSYVPFTSKPGDTIYFDGDAYQLVSVERDFLYRPAVTLDTGGVAWDKDMVENINPSSLLWKNADGTRMEPVPLKDRIGKKLFTVRITRWKSKTSTNFDVTADNDEMLKTIRAIIGYRSNMEGLKTLGNVLETGAAWLKLPFYFIPGFGEAVMAADLVVGIIQFFGSDEFRIIKDVVINGDGQALITKSIEKVESLFTKDGLWDALFDDAFVMPTFDEKPKTAEGDSVVKHSDGKIMKLLRALLNFGKKLWNGLAWIKNKVNYALRKIHMFILNRPMLAAVIGYITHNFYFIAATAGKSIRILENVLDKDESGKNEVEEPDGFSGVIGSMVGHLGEIQVPLNLVPIEILLDIIVRMAMKLIRGPAGVIAGAVKDILVETGIYDKILNLVSDKLADTDLNPNKYINDFITSKIQGPVKEAANYFLDKLFDTFSNVEDLKKVSKPSPPDMDKLTDSGDSIEDEQDVDLNAPPPVQPAQAPLAQPFPGVYFRVPLRSSIPAHPPGGSSLGSGEKEELESTYGQDFSHVRIHNDADADAATNESGAEALTTGSHIYLKKDLSTRDETGKSILRHELAHVIQQTGSRPIDKEHSDKPVDGSPGQGLVFDPGQEDEANAFAAQNGKDANPGINSNAEGGKGGIQPSWASVSLKFFDSVSSEPKLTPIDAVAKLAMFSQPTEREKVLAKNIPNAILDGLKKLSYHDRMIGPSDSKTKNTAIETYLGSGHLKMSDLDSRQIVKLSKIKKKISGKDSDDMNWVLDPKRLNDQLEEYILIKTGVMTEIKTEISGDSIDVKEMKVNNIFIDKSEVNETIWKSILDNTFSAAARGKRFDSKFTGSAADITTYMNAGKRVIFAYDTVRVFAGAGFKLLDALAKRIEREVSEPVLGLKTGGKEIAPPDDEDGPIPINWYKPLGDYPPKITLNKKTYQMNSTDTISYNGNTIRMGVAKKWMVLSPKDAGSKEKATKLYRTSSSGKRTNSEIYREALKSNGYDLPKLKQDIDHVTDLGFSGPDEFENLWPLISSVNRIAFMDAWYLRYTIEYLKSASDKTKQVGTIGTLKDKWFVIKGYNYKPETPGGRWEATK